MRNCSFNKKRFYFDGQTIIQMWLKNVSFNEKVFGIAEQAVKYQTKIFTMSQMVIFIDPIAAKKINIPYHIFFHSSRLHIVSNPIAV